MPGKLEELIKKVVQKDPVAASIKRAAKIDVSLGELDGRVTTVAGGEFDDVGVIGSEYLDHGTEENLLAYGDTDFVGHPYGTWEINELPYTEAGVVDGDEYNVDMLELRSPLNTYSAWVPFTATISNHRAGEPHVISAYWIGAPDTSLVQMRVRGFPTKTHAINGTNVSETFTLTAVDLTANERVRLSFPFTPTANFLRVEVRAQRTSGISGTWPAANMYHAMLETVVEGQTAPSKWVPPAPRRGGLPVNVLEGNALESYIAGLEVTRLNASEGQVSSGSAYIPGLGRIVELPSPEVATTGLTNGVKYVYFSYSLSFGPTITCSTTPPASPYSGTARHMTGDDTERFIGVLVVIGGVVVHFLDQRGYFTFQDNVSSRQVASGSNLLSNTINLAPYMPEFSTAADVQIRSTYNTANGTIFVGTPGVHLVGSGEGVLSSTSISESRRGRARGMVRTNASRELVFAVSDAGITGSVDMMGFWYDR